MISIPYAFQQNVIGFISICIFDTLRNEHSYFSLYDFVQIILYFLRLIEKLATKKVLLLIKMNLDILY